MGMAATDSQFHVLAVDDNLIDRKVIEGLLKKSYQVTTVDSGSKALEFLGFHQDGQSKPYVSPNNDQEVEVNLIITDYCMPGMTGYDLLKKIKESSVLRDIPVVIMSSENVPSRISSCLEEGAEEFFLKPVKEEDVIKLRAHMMKTTHTNHQNTEIFEAQSNEGELAPQTLEILELQQGQEPPQQQHQSSSNKRKAMEEEISSDRTRSRYNGLTVVN